ncbi:uncharacterized protein LOC129615812 [Condylostylus longicornis]|uniref:uncharacterized protein LOC129615812 n=1 Tax=Condylostylus longicornis TaxID=2530218 RepID=UPI00244DC632|nr:uncharacterized protein LOC129615812 [Condylostylus longicornis]
MKQLNDLKQSLNILETQVLELKTVRFEDSKIIPEKPFENKEEFIKFDKSLTDDIEKIKALKQNFARCDREDVRNFVKRNLRKLMIDNVVRYFSWSGTEDKISVKNFNCISILKDVCLSTIQHATEANIDYHIKRFFQYAKQRIQLSGKINHL